MSGNASYRLANTAVLSVCAVEAPIVVTSAWFDERLAETYDRVGMRPGMLEELAGVRERRWWPEDVSFADAAAMVGAKALAEAGITPTQIGVMINSSVSRAYLEPSTAVAVHHQLGLPTSCLNFDLANACLGFVNGIQLAGTMIDSGQADYALLVDAEGSRFTQETTLNRLAGPDATSDDLRSQFATLALGTGREAGAAGFDWTGIDSFVAHQTSVVHIRAMASALGVPESKFPLTLPTYGNMAPAAVPFTLAQEVDRLSPGMRVLLLGIGSGLNTSYAEIIW